MAWTDPSLTELARAATRGVFGSPCTYQVGEATPVTTTPAGAPLAGVFRSSYVQTDPASGTKVTTERPNVFVSLADLPAAPAEGHRLVIQGASYRVGRVELDGEGGALLLLSRVGP